MNFFAHASVALWRSQDPRFLLGAMLPDLTAMLGQRLVGSSDPVLDDGIQFHHATDAAFHAAEQFVSMCSKGVQSMTAAGMRRGSARAIAHVGIELLLDGRMSSDRSARAAYGQALRHAVDERLSDTLSLPKLHDSSGRGSSAEDSAARGLRLDENARMHRGLERLLSAPIPEGYRDPTFVVGRLEAILARRPRLALLQAGEVEIAEGFVRDADRELAGRWELLLEQVRSGLAHSLEVAGKGM